MTSVLGQSLRENLLEVCRAASRGSLSAIPWHMRTGLRAYRTSLRQGRQRIPEIQKSGLETGPHFRPQGTRIRLSLVSGRNLTPQYPTECGRLRERGFWSAIPGMRGWGGRIRTSVWRNQNPLPYHLATPQCRRKCFATSGSGGTIAAARSDSNSFQNPCTMHFRYYIPAT